MSESNSEYKTKKEVEGVRIDVKIDVRVEDVCIQLFNPLFYLLSCFYVNLKELENAIEFS